MRRQSSFSLLLLSLIIMLAFTSCGVIESRISHALSGDINSVVHTEKTIKKNPEEIIINWKNGDISFVRTNRKEILIAEDSYTTLTKKTEMQLSEKENKLFVDYADKRIIYISPIFKKDLTLYIPNELDKTKIYINGQELLV